ncbi:hypothetical protein SAMN06265374_0978 [Roseibium denhamense]|uniref:Uncharacterized protein n=1 Tax=Roseibium denhamense TaxID=76305 RepID=A0ABY1NG88_9HYPH|nr:hypothetical protein SAMN06265374_0978 [Roseibium denhamense]
MHQTCLRKAIPVRLVMVLSQSLSGLALATGRFQLNLRAINRWGATYQN